MYFAEILLKFKDFTRCPPIGPIVLHCCISLQASSLGGVARLYARSIKKHRCWSLCFRFAIHQLSDLASTLILKLDCKQDSATGCQLRSRLTASEFSSWVHVPGYWVLHGVTGLFGAWCGSKLLQCWAEESLSPSRSTEPIRSPLESMTENVGSSTACKRTLRVEWLYLTGGGRVFMCFKVL